MLHPAFLLLLISLLRFALAAPSKRGAPGWGSEVKTIVTFGDSYTDESRFAYFVLNGGRAPPAGWIAPINPITANGGYSWARYVAWQTGATLYNYAVGSAACSNKITPRYLGLMNGIVPSVAEYEIPAFEADLAAKNTNVRVDWSTTVVSIWIGGNDLGPDGLITQSQVPGTTLVDYTRCVFDSIRALHKLGARRFVLMNVAPMELAPLYAPSAPAERNRYWTDKPENSTAVHGIMASQVAAVNEIFALGSQTLGLADASIAVMDTYSLMKDIYQRPGSYLNGSQPLDVTGFNEHCSWLGICYWTRMEDRDSFMWYNELHFSEQVGRIVAKEWINSIKGSGKWAKYW